MPGIDDPLDAVKRQYPESTTPAGILIDVGAEMHPFAGMANAVRNFFSKREAEARVRALLQALEWYVREHERRIEEITDRTDSPEFIEALLVAVDKSLHTANVEKIKQFARVLGHELLSDGDARNYEDAAAYIRTLSELREADIEVLSIIHAFQSLPRNNEGEDFPKTDKPGQLFWGVIEGINSEVARRAITTDDFFSRCSKLRACGLLHKAGVGASFWYSGGDDMPYEIEGGAYYITQSGRKLIEILGNSPELMAEAVLHRRKVLADIERRRIELEELNKNAWPSQIRQP